MTMVHVPTQPHLRACMAGLQPLEHLDGIDGHAPQPDARAGRMAAVGFNPEQAHHAV